MRRKNVFTQGKGPGTRLIISSPVLNVRTYFLTLRAERQVTCEKITRKWRRPMKKHRKIAHKRSKLIFNIFFLVSL